MPTTLDTNAHYKLAGLLSLCKGLTSPGLAQPWPRGWAGPPTFQQCWARAQSCWQGWAMAGLHNFEQGWVWAWISRPFANPKLECLKHRLYDLGYPFANELSGMMSYLLSEFHCTRNLLNLDWICWILLQWISGVLLWIFWILQWIFWSLQWIFWIFAHKYV